jgi:hypothetical protein
MLFASKISTEKLHLMKIYRRFFTTLKMQLNRLNIFFVFLLCVLHFIWKNYEQKFFIAIRILPPIISFLRALLPSLFKGKSLSFHKNGMEGDYLWHMCHATFSYYLLPDNQDSTELIKVTYFFIHFYIF